MINVKNIFMIKTGNLKYTVDEMKEESIGILTVQKTRSTEAGKNESEIFIVLKAKIRVEKEIYAPT